MVPNYVMDRTYASFDHGEEGARRLVLPVWRPSGRFHELRCMRLWLAIIERTWAWERANGEELVERKRL
jgi:hypothetical protein